MLTLLFPEILSHIMILARESIPLDNGLNEDRDLDVDFPPEVPFEIAISHVNSFIRFTALHTARLWSSIHIDTGAQSAHIILERTATYLTRSNGHALDLRIELNDVPLSGSHLDWSGSKTRRGFGPNWELREAMGLLEQKSTRWRKLTIVAEHQGISDVCAGIRGRLVTGEGKCLTPELEYLSISVDYDDDSLFWNEGVDDSSYLVTGPDTLQLNGRQQVYPHSDNINATPTFRGAAFQQHPNLSFLRLRGLALYLFQPTLQPVLRILHIDQTKALPLSFHFFANIVTACPALEHLSIYGDIIMPTMASDTMMQAVTPVLGGDQNHSQHYQTGYAAIAGDRSRSKPEQAIDMTICLSELRSLRLCGITGSVYKVILTRLEAPKLMSLFLKDAQEHDLDTLWEESIANSTESTSARFGGVENNNPRSDSIPRLVFTQLQTLVINNSYFSETLYQRLFQVFPCITEFVSYLSMEVDTAPDLLAGGAAMIPWPHLHTLTFTFDVDLDADDEALEKLLRQRRESGYPVDRLRIGVADLDVEGATGIVRQETVVMMKSLDDIDNWPLDQQYLDVDDILF